MRDNDRQRFLENKGVKVLRFTSDEVISDLDRMIENIFQECDTLPQINE